MRSVSRDDRDGCRGFTLVEIIVAIGIVAVIMAVSVPAFHRWRTASELRAAAFGVSNALRMARDTAVTTNREARVEFDMDGRRHRIEGGNLSTGSTSWTPEGPWSEVETGAGWATGIACSGTADISVSFRTNGSSDGGTICIMDATGSPRFRINVSAITGRVSME